VTYSFTVLGNANNPGNLDTHIQFISLNQNFDTTQYEGNSGADYWKTTELWLRILSGTAPSTACTVDIAWKTNAGFSNPNAPDTNSLGQYEGGEVLWFTNSVRAGTWLLTFKNATQGSITCPGTNSTGVDPVPFDLGNPVSSGGNVLAGPLSYANATNWFGPPMGVRIGNMNNGNSAWGGLPDDWIEMNFSNTAGTNFTVNWAQQGSTIIDPTIWDLLSSDVSAIQTVVVPTNVLWWITWNTPDIGYWLVTSTNLKSGPWRTPEYYNAYGDGVTNVLPTTELQGTQKWTMLLPQYMPTLNGGSNPVVTNLDWTRLGPKAFFGLTTNTFVP